MSLSKRVGDVYLDFQALTPHPSMPPSIISGVGCSISWKNPRQCNFGFMVSEPLNAVRTPEIGTLSRRDGLMTSTCFQLFLRRPDSKAYLEFQFSPSGDWAAYEFDGYRSGRRDFETTTPWIHGPDPKQFAMASCAKAVAEGMDPETARKMVEATQSVRVGRPPTRFGMGVYFAEYSYEARGPWLANLSAMIEEADGVKSYWALSHPSGEPDFHHPDAFVLQLP